jgi:hypothetical protein
MKKLHIHKTGTPQGDININMAIKGKLIAIKGSANNPTALSFIAQYKAKGAVIQEKRDCVVINIFTFGKTVFKLGSVEIDLEEDDDIAVENKLSQFYIDTISKAGFEVD